MMVARIHDITDKTQDILMVFRRAKFNTYAHALTTMNQHGINFFHNKIPQTT